MRVRTRALGTLLAGLLAAVGLAPASSADLGAPVIDRTAGPYRIVAFASPVPLRVGTSDWTLLVLDRARSEPARDVEVRMVVAPHLDDPHAEHRHAGHRAPSVVARVGVPERIRFDVPGPWHYEVSVSPRADHRESAADDASRIRVSGSLDVQPDPGFWRAHGAAVVAPYAALALFALHQIHRARSQPGGPRTPRPPRTARRA